jgi:hypothetical protein
MKTKYQSNVYDEGIWKKQKSARNSSKNCLMPPSKGMPTAARGTVLG